LEQNIQLQLKALRKAKGVTQKELARAVHVSFQTISKWENGIALPDITYLPALAKFFEVEMEVLLGMKPIELKLPLENYTLEDYWATRVQCTKDYKIFFYNDDYLEFLVKQVWKFEKPVCMLDIACGYGYLAQKLLPYMPEGSSYTGLDISEAFLQEGRRLFQGDARVHFVQGDILKYKVKKKYDLVISQLLFSFLPNPEEILNKMRQALKPSGMLAVIDCNLAMNEEGFFIAKGQSPYLAKIPDPKKVWEFSEKKGERHYRMGTQLPFLLKKNGLKHIHARMSDCVFVYDGADSERKEEEIVKFRNIVNQLERVKQRYAYYLNRGSSWQEAESFVSYQQDIQGMLEQEDVFVVRTSCLYIVWGYID